MIKNMQLSGRNIAISIVALIALVVFGWIVVVSNQGTDHLSIRELAELPGSETSTILPSECMQFLGLGSMTESGPMEHAWLGTREDFYYCQSLVIDLANAITYTPMVQIEIVEVESDEQLRIFSKSCAPHWMKLPGGSESSSFYQWTGAASQLPSCMFDISLAQERQQHLLAQAGGDTIRPSPRLAGSVIHAP